MTLADSGADRMDAAGDSSNDAMSGSASVLSQNFSLASSSSSSVTACGPVGGLSASSYNPSPMMERSGDIGAVSTSSSPVPTSTDGRYPRRRRAPDMQLGRCPWIRVYDNVTYIVAGIIIREVPDGSADASPELLLIQEAKRKCCGKWYLPAGHVEPGETIEAACRREVLEETGFECRVDGLICMETRGSGWYRMSFACTITAGRLKTEPDRESLAAGWHSVERLRRQTKRSAAASGDEIPLRCRDFLPIVDEALRYREWRVSQAQQEDVLELGTEPDEDEESDGVPSESVIQRAVRAPVLNRNEAQPGLFIEFVIVKHSSISDRVECLVHGSVREQRQLLQPAADAFPTVEFGFEFFFPMVVSKCYRHIFEAGHQAIDLPEAVLAMWCLPAPIESVRQGLRLRILCRHKRAIAKAPLCVPQRYHWLSLDDRQVLAELRLLPGQYRPPLFML